MIPGEKNDFDHGVRFLKSSFPLILGRSNSIEFNLNLLFPNFQ